MFLDEEPPTAILAKYIKHSFSFGAPDIQALPTQTWSRRWLVMSYGAILIATPLENTCRSEFLIFTLASSFWFSALTSLRSHSIFSSLARSIRSSSLAVFSCSSVRWTLSRGVTRTRRRHHGQSRTARNAFTLRWMQRTASSWGNRLYGLLYSRNI